MINKRNCVLASLLFLPIFAYADGGFKFFSSTEPPKHEINLSVPDSYFFTKNINYTVNVSYKPKGSNKEKNIINQKFSYTPQNEIIVTSAKDTAIMVETNPYQKKLKTALKNGKVEKSALTQTENAIVSGKVKEIPEVYMKGTVMIEGKPVTINIDINYWKQSDKPLAVNNHVHYQSNYQGHQGLSQYLFISTNYDFDKKGFFKSFSYTTADNFIIDIEISTK